MTTAPDRNWQSYSNEVEDDCIEAAIANVILARDGTAPSNDAVQAMYRSWLGRIAGGNTGFRMWQFLFSGWFRSFGMMSKSEHQWAIDAFGGIIAGLNGGHEVAAVGYTPTGIQYVSLGQLQTMSWADWQSQVDRDCFAFSNKFDIRLPLKALRNNWTWWIVAAAMAAVTGELSWNIWH